MAATYPQPAKPKLSATGRSVLRRRREPGTLPAALFAVVVHAGFFALIIFGVSWQVKAPTTLNADIWQELPDINASNATPVKEIEPLISPPPAPTPPVQEVKTPTPDTSRADIVLKEKKLRDEKLKAEQQKRELDKKKAAEKKADDEKMRREMEAERVKARVDADARDASRQAAAETAARSARDKAIQDYAGKIRALISNRANIPESVTGKPVVTIRLRLLVNGAVLDAQMVQASGNRAYDEAVERAINGIRQWPLPEDPALLGGRRELNLRIEHER